MRRKSALSLWLVLLLSAIAAHAQERPEIKAPDIAPDGSATSDFVPRGWKIEEEIKGDLNRDGVPDVALKLVEDLPAKDKDDAATARGRVLVVLLRKTDGRFERAGVAVGLLLCTRCGGAFYGVAESPAEVSIRNGVLIVKQSFGSRELTEMTYRFRYDAAARRFQLIGFDKVMTDRLTGRTTDESTNYLTGLKIVKKFRVNERTGEEIPVATTRRKIAAGKIYLEEVDYEKMI